METTTASTFAQFGECFRCHGFKRAFDNFSHVAGGTCFRCGGTLREDIIKPAAQLDEYAPSRRAESIAVIAKVLSLVGQPIARDANGAKVSAWGFASYRKGDNERAFCAALSIAPDDVRARGWAAFCRKVRETMPTKGDAPMGYARRLVAHYTGLPADAVGAWLGETAAESVAA